MAGAVLTGSGNLFGYPSTRTWEWTVSQPIRSVFPLWLFYGLPLTLLNWLWAKEVHLDITPGLVYFSLRAVMFMLSFVLEDWAVHDLVQSPKLRQQAVVLVASSYVTWTFQTHTFSNSIETVLVLWSLLLLDRIAHERVSLLRLLSCMYADCPAEAFSYRRQLRTRFCPCFGHFQSHYFSNIHIDTRHALAATFIE